MKRQPTELEKNFAIIQLTKAHAPKYTNDSYNSTTTQFENGQKT